MELRIVFDLLHGLHGAAHILRVATSILQLVGQRRQVAQRLRPAAARLCQLRVQRGNVLMALSQRGQVEGR